MATDVSETVFEMLNILSEYYSDDDTIWQKLPEMSPSELKYEVDKLIVDKTIAGYNFSKDVAINGTTLGYNAEGYIPKSSTTLGGSALPDSNLDGSTFGDTFKTKIPLNVEQTPDNKLKATSGATKTAIGSTIAAVADRVSLAVMGVNLGAKFGKGFDELLYKVDPNFWDNTLPDINPEKWSVLCGKSEVGDFFLRTLFGITEDNSGLIGYVPEELLAYYYQTMRDNAFFADGGRVTNPEAIPDGFPEELQNYVPIYSTSSPTIHVEWVMRNKDTGAEKIEQYNDTYRGSDNLIARAVKITDEGSYYNISIGNITEGNAYTYDNKSIGSWGSNSSNAWKTAKRWEMVSAPVCTNAPVNTFTSWPRAINQFAWLIAYGYSSMSGHEGVSDLDGATQYPPTNITGGTPDEVLQQLKQHYPELFDGSITARTPQPDGSYTTTTYVPVPWATTGTQGDTVTTGEEKTQQELKLDPQTIQQILQQTKPGEPTQPPDTGDGSAPPVVMPTGNASSLWAVYHPSQSQLNAFGAWLWSSDFVEQIKRLFTDPMQAIIGVHKVFAPIPTGGSQNIKCGYLDSGVSSPTVSSQYTEVDCGTVDCREYFGNVFDYDPHTKVSIYLPFIGVVPLKVSEVMRSSITVTYGVDVITGACLAKVKVTRDGGGAILYSYGGSCACHYPISSGSYAGIISGIVTSAIGIAGGIATGNPLSAIGGAMAGLHQAHTDVQRSGGFTGCAGAMGPKIPYLIIDRPQTRLASDFGAYQGRPANSTQFIGDCSGFVRATEVHFSAPGVFDEEAREIESLLKAGVKLD